MSTRNAFAGMATALAGFLVLSGCIKVSARDDAGSLSQLSSDQVLVVGAIELIRPLVENEQLLTSKGTPHFKNKAYILLDKESYDLNNIPVMAANKATGVVTVGKIFFLPVNKGQTLRYSGGVIVMNDEALFRGTTVGGVFGIWNLVSTDHFTLPGGLKFNLAKSDKAVYIGTIQYYRDEFNAVTKIKIKDDYAQASAEFKRKYNSQIPLKRISSEK